MNSGPYVVVLDLFFAFGAVFLCTTAHIYVTLGVDVRGYADVPPPDRPGLAAFIHLQ